MSFSEMCDWIIILGAVCVAIKNIYNFITKPKQKIKENISEQIRIETKKALEEHSAKVAEERSTERETQLQKVKTDILNEVRETLSNILEINKQQSENINILMVSSKDVLRQKIMDIYHEYKAVKRLPLYAKEKLDELYKDYKAEKGNSYIDKYYNRMTKWEVYDEEDED